MMNIHCQPFSPIQPSRLSSAPEIGAPITVEIGMANMNRPTMRAR